ncbi:3-keto-disaccharide hydrolase [Membranihabitans marinus]|uniref:3-keto-disaccharide hydrolase n=1 Tax=Membranihabitans marinus TaxID=1227546 RepID=UPI001F23A00C|nr:DUF1080 domain-containing protein [Membranihabitans marinus]
MLKIFFNFLFLTTILSFSYGQSKEWQPLLQNDDLSTWTVRGEAKWVAKDGVITGSGANGHLYAQPLVSDLEVKGKFRISDQGGGSNGGLYFRANPPANNPESYPHGYEAQICHNQSAHTGWLWKPGKPTGKATKLLTKDDEWFDMHVIAIGPNIEIFINGQSVMKYRDSEYKTGYIALQCHNAGMTIEAKDLFYKKLIH